MFKSTNYKILSFLILNILLVNKSFNNIDLSSKKSYEKFEINDLPIKGPLVFSECDIAERVLVKLKNIQINGSLSIGSLTLPSCSAFIIENVTIWQNQLLTNGVYKNIDTLKQDIFNKWLEAYKFNIKNINKKDSRDRTALMLAARNGHVDIVKALIAGKADLAATMKNGGTALMLAAQNEHVEVVKALIESKADLDIKDWQGRTALMLATQNWPMFATQNRPVDIVKALIEGGAKVDATDNFNKTALMFAAEHGHVKVATTLIENGANVDATTKDGMTALMFAARYGYIRVVQALIDNNAKVDTTDNFNNTALVFAEKNKHTYVINVLKEEKKTAKK